MANIRRATILDRQSVEDVYAIVAGTSLSLSDDEWHHWLDVEGIVIAEVDDRVIGFGGIDTTAREHLRWLYLLPEYQRSGFGSRILSDLERVAWTRGLQSIRLHATPNAVQFYSKRGYTPIPHNQQLGHDHDGVEMIKGAVRTIMGHLKSNRLALLIFAIVVCAPTVLTQNDAQQKDLPNFHQVSEKLYRGGQPTDAGLKRLVQQGVKTIVNLRDDDDHARAEGTTVVAAGLRYFNLPLSNFHKPSEEQIAKVLSLINAPENQPVFVHCKRGSDRTGTIIAVYRMEHDGWTADQAKQEAEHFGLGFWQIRMKDYISDYYRHKLAKSEKSAPESPPKHQ